MAKKTNKLELSRTQAGLTVGIFCAAIHALWAVLVALGVGQRFMSWVFPMHFLSSAYTVLPFSIATALFLIAIAFLLGYVMGWLFAALWNWAGKVA